MMPNRMNGETNRVIHDIRNMRPIDEQMLNEIRKMSEEDKMEIIAVCNQIIQLLVETIGGNEE